jgi:hypothetical protein
MENIMKIANSCIALCLLSALFGCVGPGPSGNTAIVFNLAPSPCIGVEQYAKKIGAAATYKELIKAEANVEPLELVDYEAKLALLQNQSQQACDLFNRGRIDWAQYQSEMKGVRETLKEITRDIRRFNLTPQACRFFAKKQKCKKRPACYAVELGVKVVDKHTTFIKIRIFDRPLITKLGHTL